MSTPRPSISPLSSAKNSPAVARTAAMGDTGGDVEDRDTLQLDDEEKDDSSLLSEPEDDDREEEVLKSMAMGQITSRKDDVDSEAETERLEFTPKHARDLAEAGIGRTPSKLSKVEQQADALSEPPSPTPHDVGAASSTSTVANGGKKRKRSSNVESPLSSEASIDGEIPRKRLGSSKADNTTEDNSREETTEVVEDNSRSTKMHKSTSRRGRSEREVVEARDTIEAEDDAPEAEPEVEETVEAQVEEDPVQKSEATDAFTQLAKQFTAFRNALYNERLASVEQELSLLERPECQHPEYLRMVACVQQRRLKQDRETRAYHHYRQTATQQRTLAERAQLHSQYYQTIREVREAALDTLGTSWYSIQRERRQGVGTHADEDYRHVYRYVDKRGDLLRQQAKYNREVSVLSGIAKYVGFPAAPEIQGVEGDGFDEDLRAMKLARPIQQHSGHQHQAVRQTAPYTQYHATAHPHRQPDMSAASAERSAHEKYIEQHAWARAPQSNNYAPLTNTPTISHTSGWAEHTGLRKSNPMPTPMDRIVSLITPMNGGSAHVNSTQGVPDSAEHREYIPPGSSPLQIPKQRLNGTESNEWRNHSGTSTIDAPLGEGAKEYDPYEHEHYNPVKRDFAREQPDGRPSLPGIGSSAQAFDTQHRAPLPSSMFPIDKTEMFRAAGFRPLEGPFASPASSTVAGRGIGSG